MKPSLESVAVCDPAERGEEFNTQKGKDSVFAVAAMLRAGGNEVLICPTSGKKAPHDLVVNGRKVEVKVCFRRDDGIWLFNIHRHGVLDESEVDAYVLRLEGVPEFKNAIHLIVPSPIGSSTVNISLRSLISRYARYYNRFDLIGGKDCSAFLGKEDEGERMSDFDDIWGDPKKHEPDADDEGEEIDPDAASNDTANGAELDWAHGYGRGQ